MPPIVGATVEDLLQALRFLTTLPVGRGRESVTYGAACFPAAGLLIGAIAVVVDAGAFFLPDLLRNIVVVTAMVIVTGALHLDALADVADSLGGASLEQRLRIMRDSRIGTFGVTAIVIAVGGTLAALSALSGFERLAALLLAPALGRWAMVTVAFEERAARPDGLGADFVREASDRDLRVSSATAVVLGLALGGRAGIVALGMSAVVALGVRRFSRTWFGGLTGDTIGAAGALAELVTLGALATVSGG